LDFCKDLKYKVQVNLCLTAIDSDRISYTLLKKQNFASVICKGSKFQADTLKIFNVVNENKVTSNLNLTFTLNFIQIYIKFNKKCTKLHKIL